MAAANAKGVAPTDPALTALIRQMMGDIETNVREMLGSTGYQRYSEYRRALSAMEIVGSLAARSYGTAEPLQRQQGEQLTRLIVDQTRTVPAAPGSKSVRYETDWTAVGEEAKRVLSSGQATTLQALLDMKELQARMSALSRAQRLSEGTASSGGTP